MSMNLASIVQLTQRFRSPLAITGLVLLGLYAIAGRILELRFAQLTPEGSVQILQTLLRYVFIIALVAIVLSIVAFVLPKILPKSLFIPAPQLRYGVVVFHMYDPFQESGIARTLDSIEPFPSFPYYSRESDHPSAWPERVFKDRTSLYEKLVTLFTDPDLRERLAKDPTFNGDSITPFSSAPGSAEETKLKQYIMNARSHVLQTAQKSDTAIEQLLGADLTNRVIAVERERAELRKWFPNRLAVIRLRNAGSQDILNLGIEVDISGIVYDHKIEADPKKVRNVNWEEAAGRVTFERLPSAYTAEIRIWYLYQSLSGKAFPDKIDIINELTQGIKVLNISASRTQVRYNEELVEDLTGYDRLYIGDARKKDSYETELAAFMKKRNEEFEEFMKEDEKKNETSKDVAISELEQLEVADDQIDNIWLGFRSPAGVTYDAVHVFEHPKGPYVLLCNKDKNEEDLRLVQSKFVELYAGTADPKISDRTDDICTTVDVASGFTKSTISQAATSLQSDGYSDLIISRMHYHVNVS
jgi:hypothetical protein